LVPDRAPIPLHQIQLFFFVLVEESSSSNKYYFYDQHLPGGPVRNRFSYKGFPMRNIRTTEFTF